MSIDLTPLRPTKEKETVVLNFKEVVIWKQDGRVPINHYGASDSSRQERSTQLITVIIPSHWQRQCVLVPVSSPVK